MNRSVSFRMRFARAPCRRCSPCSRSRLRRRRRDHGESADDSAAAPPTTPARRRRRRTCRPSSSTSGTTCKATNRCGSATARAARRRASRAATTQPRLRGREQRRRPRAIPIGLDAWSRRSAAATTAGSRRRRLRRHADRVDPNWAGADRWAAARGVAARSRRRSRTWARARRFPTSSGALRDRPSTRSLTQYCSRCHSSGATTPQSPFFAEADVDEAYAAAQRQDQSRPARPVAPRRAPARRVPQLLEPTARRPRTPCRRRSRHFADGVPLDAGRSEPRDLARR